MTTSRATAAAGTAARSAAVSWKAHLTQCAACHPGTPAATCPTGLRLWREKRTAAGELDDERAADGAELPGQHPLW